jgi:hypothetical protein
LPRVFAVTRTMGVEGVADRIHVAVWTSDEDRTLVAAESFGTVGDLEGWLRTWRAPGDEAPTVVWTEDLRRDPALARAVAAALGVTLPPRPPRRGRRAADVNDRSR